MLYKLDVLNGSLNKLFVSDVFEYEVAIDSDATFLDLKYETCESCSVTIYGNENLVGGENHILIEVFDEKVVTYTLKVNKEMTEKTFEVLEDVPVKNELISKMLAPGIGTICFLLIVICFNIIFRKK